MGITGGGNGCGYGGGGGGATHIATKNGLLSTLESYKTTDLLLVAGGGAGVYRGYGDSKYGYGGGTTGGTGSGGGDASPGTQTSGGTSSSGKSTDQGAFGLGGSCEWIVSGDCARRRWWILWWSLIYTNW